MDGELDSAGEQELFDEMATNDAMRGEFKNLLAISAAVKNNKQAFTKNKKSKKAVFAALGLSIPVADAVSGGVATTAAGSAVGYGLKSLLATGVLSAVVTAILLWGLGDSNTENNTKVKKVDDQILSQQLIIELPEENSDPTPIVSSRDVNVSNTDSRYKAMYEKAMILNNALQKQVGEFAAKLKEQESIIVAKNAQLAEYRNTIGTLESNIAVNSTNYNLLADKQNENDKMISELSNTNSDLQARINSMKTENSITPMVLQPSNGTSSWSAEWKGSQTYNDNNFEFDKSNYSQFNNNSLSIMYNFENGFSVGSELRQETFLLEFTGEDVNDVTYLYRQEPNFTTLSFLGRYTYDMSNTLDPFAEFTFGGNKIGVVGRLMGGVVYSPYQNFNMIFGLEYNNMSFQYQGDRFNSGKVGINYGVSVQF